MTTEKNAARIRDLDSRPYGFDRGHASSITVVHAGEDLRSAVEASEGPGALTLIEPGTYQLGSIRKCAGGAFQAIEKGTVTLQHGAGDTMSMMDASKIGKCVFVGLNIPASGRSAFITDDKGLPYDVSFEDCLIDGGFDHANGTGNDTKWGFVPHRWAGYAARCAFRNIKREHGIYAHTPMADTLLYECRFKNTGRTGAQFVGRNTESGYSDTELHVLRCRFDDPGLADGGSSLTAYGIRSVLVEDSEFWIGRDQRMVDGWMARKPQKKAFSTGHFVNWKDSNRASPSQSITFKRVLMHSAPGTGEAACMQVKNCEKLTVTDGLYIQTGYNTHAVELASGMEYALENPGKLTINGSVTIS